MMEVPCLQPSCEEEGDLDRYAAHLSHLVGVSEETASGVVGRDVTEEIAFLVVGRDVHVAEMLALGGTCMGVGEVVG